MLSASEHYTLNDNEAEAYWFLGTLATIKASGALTGGALGVVEFIHPPGFATPRHVHHAEDEAFYVLEGAMRGFCGDRSWYATAGSFVWLPRGIPHGYAVDGDQILRSLAISLPAGFERFVAEAGEPTQERTLPPPAEPNVEKLLAAATKYGQEILEVV
jgi:quercetin dioxygenase-like cupin family protein